MDSTRERGIARNNSWHYYDAGSSVAVVFVHGYFSNSEKCWRNENGAFWPDLVLADRRVPDCSVFLGGYFTGLTSGKYGIRDCVDELFGALKRPDTEGRKPVLEFPQIAFVCHSLGGIVVREMFATHAQQFSDKKIGLALIASPSLGSDYATNLLSIARFYGNRVGKQLAFGSGYLEDLDRRFLKYLEGRPRDSFIGAEAIELHSPFYLKALPDFSPIVPSQSAGRYFSDRQKISENHSSIAKPNDINHASHNFLVDFTNRLTSSPTECSPASIATQPRQPRSTDVLFDIYDLSIEPHYVERELDSMLSRIVDLQSIWLSGDSGLGKSCCVMRYIARSGLKIDICLSQCGPDASRSILFKEILGTLEQRGFGGLNPQGSDPYNHLVSCLADLSDKAEDVWVFIDEVPAGPAACASDNLLSLLADLITSLKQRGCQRTPRFFVCSLAQPRETITTNPAKLGEHLSFVHVDQWTEQDLRRLYGKIIESLPQLAQTEADLQTIMKASQGSPRFLKAYFRTAYSRNDLIKLQGEMLRLTRQQLSMDR